MKKFFKVAAVVAASVMLAGTVGYDATINTMATDQSDVDEAENSVEESKKKLEQVQNQLAQLQSEISSTETYIADLDAMAQTLTLELVQARTNVDNKQAEIDAKQLEIDAMNDQIADKESELKATQEEEAAQYEAMKLRIQYMYERGNENLLEYVFSSKDLSELLGRSEYIAQITEYDREQLEKLVETENTITALIASLDTDKASLETERATLETQKADLVTLQQGVEDQQSYVNEVLNAKQAALNNLEGQQAATAAQEAIAKQELADQEEILNQIKAMWAAQQAAGVTDADTQKTLEAIGLAGGFTWPIPGYNRVTSEWGNRLHPIFGYYTLHDGMDISGYAINGKPIVAAYDGTVTLAQYYGGYGNCVQLSHGAGVVTMYGHMSAIAVTQGQTVKAGDVIGYVGSTGNSTGPHLHFCVYINGVSMNPRDYITIPSY